MTTPASDCSNCRHHSKQPRAHPLWLEGDQMRTLDDDIQVFVCRAPKGPFVGKEMLEPIHCDAYSEGRNKGLPSDLTHKLDAALERLSKRTDPRED